MNPDVSSHVARNKCPSCGLVNAGSDQSCRRCGTLLYQNNTDESYENSPVLDEEPVKPRSLLKRVVWIVSATLVLLLVGYVSLLITSDALLPNERDKVQSAIAVLDSAGFTRQVFILKHLTSFRRTDNWWNRSMGHREAYAATNFPFEVVTLYPEFFNQPIDDKERAAVLLHEAFHLTGAGEEAALESTWRSKQRFGWTADRYKQTRVWNSTEQLTRPLFPYMFACGADGKSDCF